MRLLFLSSLYPPLTRGGGELSTHFIAQGLVARGHEVTVVTAGPPSQSELNGVQVVRLPWPLTAKPLFEERHSRRVSKMLAAYLNDHQYDIIHAHDFRTALALAHLSLPHVVVTARDYAQICGSTNNLAADGSPCPGCTWRTVWRNHRVVEAPLWRKPFRAWQYAYNIDFRQTAFRSFRHQIFISRRQQHEIMARQDLRHTTTHVIYNPVSPDFLRPLRQQPITRDLLYVGTVEMYKGVGLLLQAFHEVAQHVPDVHLKIVGDGAQRQEYEKLVGSLGLQYRVTFTGRVAWDKLLPLYDAASVVVAPHLWIEPFGRTVVEAMARGKVVVAAQAGGPAEIITPGVTGLLFTSRDTSSLVATLKQALALKPLDRREIEAAARRWVEEHVTGNQIAAEHEALYEQILTE